VPRPFPAESRRDVIAVSHEGGRASVSRFARDSGNSESCLARSLKIADREDGWRWATSTGRMVLPVVDLARRDDRGPGAAARLPAL
jgi:hypothetical protein